MGIRLFGSSANDSSRSTYPPTLPPAGNPIPWRFKVERVEQVGAHVAAIIVYPDARNFEGRKILTYLDATEGELRSKAELDPHFEKPARGVLRPFARFEPTERGWNAAVASLRSIAR